MTNDEARIVIERALHIPVAEADAAWILASIEQRLRNETSQQSAQPEVLEPICICGKLLSKHMGVVCLPPE